MKKIIIIGAGGFGREVKMLIDDINNCDLLYDFIGYYDDGIDVGTIVNGFPVLGTLKDLLDLEIGINVALGIADPATKFNIISRIKDSNINFPVLIHPSAIIGNDDVIIGKGTLICAGTIITCNIHIKEFVTINLMCTIGHDTIINNFGSFMPAVSISGNVVIHEKVYVGTGAKVINQLEIGQATIIGAGAIVSKSLPEFCTAVGIPAKPIKFHNL
jgi:sugar O-acyltransferase (sialic acid O-acetyltransferase NeuD family)